MQERNTRPDHERGRRQEGHPDAHHQDGHEETRPKRDHPGQGRHGRGHHPHDRHEGHPGGGRGRARRGEARYVLLDALADGPKHGYEMIKALEERSGGRYIPSPGTVYPTLQALEEQALVSADQTGERRTYQLTDAGKAALEAQAAEVAAFWARYVTQTVDDPLRHEVDFLEDELDQLNRVVWNGLQGPIERKDQATIRRVRQVVEACKNQVREIISGAV